MSRHGHHEAPQCLITPEQVKELVPIANIDNVSTITLWYTVGMGVSGPVQFRMNNRGTKGSQKKCQFDTMQLQ